MTKIDQFFLICWNHVWLDRYCKSAKSENYDVIKLWAKNSKKKKNQNCRRKLKLVPNDAQFQADSENI